MIVTKGIQMKKGNQQTKNAPIRNPRLRAALASLPISVLLLRPLSALVLAPLPLLLCEPLFSTCVHEPHFISISQCYLLELSACWPARESDGNFVSFKRLNGKVCTVQHMNRRLFKDFLGLKDLLLLEL